MDTRKVPLRTPRIRRLGGFGAPFLVLVLVVGGIATGCADGGHGGGAADAPGVDAGTGGGTGAVVEAEVPIGHMHMPTADEVTGTWKARPDYVKALPAEWQGAYAFALSRPDVLQWLPCYCGCEGIGHRNNLDCFFQRREEKGFYAFEEHGSYCDICVETANLASGMLREGRTMLEIRAAVDATFGGRAPGTDTALPPT